MTYPQNPPGQPQFQPPNQAGGHYPPQPPPKKKSNVGLIIGIIAVVLLVLCGGTVACIAFVGNAVNDAAKTAADGTGTGPASSAGGGTTVGLNQPARDGKFEFTVTKVECGKASVGKAPLTKKAQGQFCLISVKVKNIGDEARTFASFYQYAFNAAGAKYDADGAASIYLDDSNSFANDINPGNTVDGVVVFDIPKDAKIVKLELHDSSLSGGVTVTVS